MSYVPYTTSLPKEALTSPFSLRSGTTRIRRSVRIPSNLPAAERIPPEPRELIFKRPFAGELP